MGNPSRFLSIVALVVITGCGSSIDKGPKKAGNNNSANNENNVSNVTPNNVTPNNVTPNNVTPNNVTPNNVTPNNGEPCVGVAPASVDFGEVPVGGQVELMVTLENCSASEQLSLDGATAPAGFEIALPEVVLVPPETSYPVPVLFAPIEAGGHVGVLTITTSAGAVSVNVQGSGSQSTEGCPTPVAQGRVGQDTYSSNVTTTSLNTVELTAMNSTAPSTIEAYEWTVVTRPMGSTARLTPSERVSNPQFSLDLAGTYEIDLNVYTAQTPAGCPAARMTITALGDDPDEITVQLTWDTPGDSNQTDSIGADLDLHYMHPMGTWNMAPYDCFWQNIEANWGADGIASVDLDDTNGMGPENISHRNASPLQYSVGVYYFADNGYGPSTGTVTIRRGGTVHGQVTKQLAMTGQFWQVGTFNAANDTFTANGTVTDDFPP